MQAVYSWREREWVVIPNRTALRAVQAATAVHVALMPAKALASAANGTGGEDSFKNVLNAALNVADYLCIGVIMFAGGSWMFGDRTRAMQHLLGGGIGYLIIRKAPVIQAFLKSL